MSTQKPKLLLIPGLVCDERLWSHQIQNLKNEVDISVVDHKPFETMDDLVSNILNETKGTFNLCGLSMGGYVALDLVRKAPERVNKLCLMATQARIDDQGFRERRLEFMKLAKRGKFKGMSPMLIRNFIHPDRLDDKEITDIIYKMAQDTGPEGFINQSKVILDRIDSRPYLKDIPCQTMVLVGREDERVPVPLSQEMADLIPNANLVILPDCGHLPPLEKPIETTYNLINWLNLN